MRRLLCSLQPRKVFLYSYASWNKVERLCQESANTDDLV